MKAEYKDKAQTMTARRFASGSSGVWILLLCVSVVHASSVGSLMRRGNGYFARGDYETALAAYQRAVVLEPDASAIRFNTGNALHRLGRYEEALRELELALADRKPERRADALYNIGNTFYRAGALEQALAAYRAALIENPDDTQAKQNLEFVLKQIEEQQQQQEQQQPPEDDEDEQDRQEQPQPQPEPDPQALDQDQAERLLQALERQDREQQEKQLQPRRQRQVERDW